MEKIYVCNTCGAPLGFAPLINIIICPNCGAESSISERNLSPDYVFRDCDVCGAKNSAVQHQGDWDVGAACSQCGGHGLRENEDEVWL